ncbi:acyltransferase [Shimia sp. MIT1388]|uniref:acyltransferase n=1 Tax=Shimia sp. MIT1388 TaxID=3096992 RepID=UPI00399B046C
MKSLVLAVPDVPGRRDGYRIELPAKPIKGKLRIALGPGSGTIKIDTVGPMRLDVRVWRQAHLHIGRNTTINKAKIVCDNADVIIGEDGLWSDDILIQSNDQHGIIDLKTRTLINEGRRRIEIGKHVWIGRRTTIMPDVTIGSGSILGTGAVLTGDMPENTVFAGVPAREVRSDTTWSRSARGFTQFELEQLGLSEPALENPGQDTEGW